MKEYIKKFSSVAAADGHVIDAPFIASVVPATEGANPLNIHCSESGKKLSVSGSSIEIVDAVDLITFYIDYVEYHAEPEMTWQKWVESKYNTCGAYIEPGGNDDTLWFPTPFNTDNPNHYSYVVDADGISILAGIIIGPENNVGWCTYAGWISPN